MSSISDFEAASTIGGGSGADTIDIESLADGAYPNGGTGAASIRLEFTIADGDLQNQIDGGAGADSITISTGVPYPVLSCQPCSTAHSQSPI